MNLQMWLTIAGIVITALFSYLAARYAGRSSVRVKEVEVDAAAYERAEAINVKAFTRLETEVKEQGKKLEELRSDLNQITQVFRISMAYIERFLLWARDGSNLPIPPIPEQLREHLDPMLIREHNRQQEETERTQAT